MSSGNVWPSWSERRPRAADRGQADQTGSDHDDELARADLSVEDADLVTGGQDVGDQQFLVADTLRHRIGRVVRERNAHVLGLDAVDLVAEDPAAAADALPKAGVAAEPAGAADRGRANPHDRIGVGGEFGVGSSSQIGAPGPW